MRSRAGEKAKTNGATNVTRLNRVEVHPVRVDELARVGDLAAERDEGLDRVRHEPCRLDGARERVRAGADGLGADPAAGPNFGLDDTPVAFVDRTEQRH